MALKYLHATLSALANKLTPSPTMDSCDENVIILNNDGIDYLNVSPTFGRFQRKRRSKMIDLLPKSMPISGSASSE